MGRSCTRVVCSASMDALPWPLAQRRGRTHGPLRASPSDHSPHCSQSARFAAKVERTCARMGHAKQLECNSPAAAIVFGRSEAAPTDRIHCDAALHHTHFMTIVQCTPERRISPQRRPMCAHPCMAAVRTLRWQSQAAYANGPIALSGPISRRRSHCRVAPDFRYLVLCCSQYSLHRPASLLHSHRMNATKPFSLFFFLFHPATAKPHCHARSHASPVCTLSPTSASMLSFEAWLREIGKRHFMACATRSRHERAPRAVG